MQQLISQILQILAELILNYLPIAGLAPNVGSTGNIFSIAPAGPGE